MAPRHGFVVYPHGPRLAERHHRADASVSGIGYVEAAAYLEQPSDHWLSRLATWIGFREPDQSPHLVPPFDASGNDRLGITAGPVPELRPGDGPDSGVRRVRGVVRPLPGGDEIVLDDWWVDAPETWRVLEGADFVVERDASEHVIVSFGLAPLVIAMPRRHHLDDERDLLDSRTRRMIPSHLTAPSALRVTISAGALVEVFGVSRGVDETSRSFELAEWEASYRRSPRPAQVMGDEDGTRLVIRVLGR